MNQALKQKLKSLPNSAGVYLHKNRQGQIIYVGKAANLKNRVRQYFQKNVKDAKTTALVEEIAMTDWLEVETEVDALFLESELIKRYKPQYNILLRDDKSATFVRIGWRDKLPFVGFTRTPINDGAEYFGPFYNGRAVKIAVRLLRKAFAYYTSPNLPRANNLDFQMGLTAGLENFPPESAEYKELMRAYRRELRQLARYLRGERHKLQAEIEAEMKILASEQKFEQAAKKRNQLRALSELGKQIVFSNEEFLDISKDHALSKLAEIFSLDTPPRRIEAYDISHISGTDTVASMVVFTNGLSDKQEYRKFKIKSATNDDFLSMKEVISRRFSAKNQNWGKPDLLLIDGGKGQLSAVFEVLDAPVPVLGIAKRDEEIVIHKTRSKIDLAWFEAQKSGKNGVIIRDEGDFLVANLHAFQSHNYGHARNLLGESNSEFTDLTKLFQRIRDEAHRFAISFHSSLRNKRQTKNRLEQIDGVGAKTRAKLLREFGSIKVVKEASQSHLAQIVGEKLAEKIKREL